MTTSVTQTSPSTQTQQRPAIRIVVADDHPVVRFGVKNMLMSDPGFDVVGEAEDGDTAITQTIDLEPDILLLDLHMPRMPGLEAMRAIMSKAARVKIVLLTATISTQQIIEALQLGARGIVLKDSVSGQLAESLRAVLSGDYWIGGERVANLVQALSELMQQASVVPERKTFGLTPREIAVVQCIVEGCSNKAISSQFAISEETVKRHLSNVFDKTGVSTRLELALFAITHKLVMLDAA
jgi:two-component system nitrate/nitrite response regulator NarL